MSQKSEACAVIERYSRRHNNESRYNFLQPDVYFCVQERQREMLRFLSKNKIHELAHLKILEVGCGNGGNLLELLRMGATPDYLQGIELIPDRFAQARYVLPPAVQLHAGDALQTKITNGSVDIVMVSTVFSSILDNDFQHQLAVLMWEWVKPGGCVLWYDFTFNNPRNPDVQGIPKNRVKELFPHARILTRRVTLAPPVARAVVRIHPCLYALFNSIPWLRTHILCWIQKK